MAEPARISNSDDALAKARRRQIFLAACRVLARKSFHEATVKEMALEAGLAAGSIYIYLQSKDEILLLLAESMVAELVEALPEIQRHAAGDPRLELLGTLHATLDVIDRYREAFAVLNHEVRYLERRPEFRAALDAIIRPYREALAGPLERGKRMGLIQFESMVSVVEALHMLCSGWSCGGAMFVHIDKETYWREIEGIVSGRFFPAEHHGRSIDRGCASSVKGG